MDYLLIITPGSISYSCYRAAVFSLSIFFFKLKLIRVNTNICMIVWKSARIASWDESYRLTWFNRLHFALV